MTSLHFKDKLGRSHKGDTPTHWTCESMRHCTCMSGGKVATTPEEAVRLSLVETYEDRDDGSLFPYVDHEIASGKDMEHEVFGLVQVGGEWFWTGHVLGASARVVVSLHD